jgi:hypothetical protein
MRPRSIQHTQEHPKTTGYLPMSYATSITLEAALVASPNQGDEGYPITFSLEINVLRSFQMIE